ncbi:CRISPR-associated protein Cas4, partial [Deinococcus xinjiangensis]|uniref:CRISPR-associated protein Cas4 n=1 Tax=Deinococcus xinjiangensis TaxID=457454 RepID=UPI00336565E8
MDEAIMLSALQHYAFCPRQCALIHVEQIWTENAQTTRGQQVHERAHGGGSEERDGIKTLRSLPLVSREHGIAGVADVVEILPDGSPRPWAGPKSWTVSSRDSAQIKGTTLAFSSCPGDGLTATFAVGSPQ